MLSEESLERIFLREGGLIDHPKDPGGITNFGITRPTYQRYCQAARIEVSNYRQAIIELTKEDASDVYNWLFIKTKSNLLEDPTLQELFFDSCIHHGESRVTRWLQNIVHTAQDGVLGPITAGAANSSEGVYASFLTKRFQYIAEITVKRPDRFLVFLEGWTNRITEFIR
jgi:lysozyme family protein